VGDALDDAHATFNGSQWLRNQFLERTMMSTSAYGRLLWCGLPSAQLAQCCARSHSCPARRECP